MLLCQNLCRCHHACLVAVVYGDEHRHQSHERLARAYVPLQQTVHLTARAHVLAYFSYHALLCTSQFKRQIMPVEPVELFTHMLKETATVFPAVVAGIA